MTLKCKFLNSSLSIKTSKKFNGKYATNHFSKDNTYSYFRPSELNDKYRTHFTIANTYGGEGEFCDFQICVNFDRTGSSKGRIFYSRGKCTGNNLGQLSSSKQKKLNEILESSLDDFNTMALEFWNKMNESNSRKGIYYQYNNDALQRYEALKVKNEVEHDLLMRDGVVGVDIDYKIKGGIKTEDIAIVVFVKEKKNVIKKARIPSEISGVKTDVWEAKFSSFSTSPQRTLQVNKKPISETSEPLNGGLPVGTFSEEASGTLGAVLPTNYGFPVMLSCMHVLADGPHTSNGDPISQPSIPHGGFYPNSSAGQFIKGFIGQPYNIDAAIGTISDRMYIENNILCLGKLKGVSQAQAGENVAKYGITTKITIGRVVSNSLSCKVEYGNFGQRIFFNQMRIQCNQGNAPFALAGDSGALVINDSKETVGMVIAGGIAPEGKYYTIANPMNDILEVFEKHGINFK